LKISSNWNGNVCFLHASVQTVTWNDSGFYSSVDSTTGLLNEVLGD